MEGELSRCEPSPPTHTLFLGGPQGAVRKLPASYPKLCVCLAMLSTACTSQPRGQAGSGRGSGSHGFPKPPLANLASGSI